MYRIFFQVSTSTEFRENMPIQGGKVHAHGYKSQSWEEIKFQETCWLYKILFYFVWQLFLLFSITMTYLKCYNSFSHCGFLFSWNVKKKACFNIVWHLNLYVQGDMKQDSPIMIEESLKRNFQVKFKESSISIEFNARLKTQYIKKEQLKCSAHHYS